MTDKDILALVNDLMKHLQLDIKSDVTQDENFFCINMTGKDARVFEENRDNKTGALLTIIKLIAKHKFEIEPRLVIDVNGQRSERLKNVVAMAKKKAEMVRISGMEEEMPPMTPAERRGVHMALKEMTGVKTESRGEEPHRRIVIVPADEE